MSLIPKRRIEDAAATELQGIPKPTPASAKPLFIAVFAKAKTSEARRGNYAAINGITKGKALWSTRSQECFEKTFLAHSQRRRLKKNEKIIIKFIKPSPYRANALHRSETEKERKTNKIKNIHKTIKIV